MKKILIFHQFAVKPALTFLHHGLILELVFITQKLSFSFLLIQAEIKAHKIRQILVFSHSFAVDS